MPGETNKGRRTKMEVTILEKESYKDGEFWAVLVCGNKKTSIIKSGSKIWIKNLSGSQEKSGHGEAFKNLVEAIDAYQSKEMKSIIEFAYAMR